MTIRSDNNDKYAQPDGLWIGAKGTPTNVGFDGPELKGAENVVIAGIDHRETACGPLAFAAAYRFLTGRAPVVIAAAIESRVVLDGKLSGLGVDNKPGSGNAANNLALAGATVEVFATDAASGERLGPALHRKTVGADGLWGPLAVTSKTSLEFVVSADGYATTHVYRAPFPRSTTLVNLRAERIAEADRDAPAVVAFARPRGYRPRATKSCSTARALRPASRRGWRVSLWSRRGWPTPHRAAWPRPSTANASPGAAGQRPITTWCCSS
jgi:hypothetical protein